MRLRSNHSLQNIIKLYEEDEDLLEDVIIEINRLEKWLRCIVQFWLGLLIPFLR